MAHKNIIFFRSAPVGIEAPRPIINSPNSATLIRTMFPLHSTDLSGWHDLRRDGDPVNGQVLLHGTVTTLSIYATGPLTYRPWAVTLPVVTIIARLTTWIIFISAARGNLTSNNVFQRFNPAAGFTYKPSHLFNTYFDYSEASRAPTSIELGCSDPTEPCNLPNALVSDPPLKQVVTRTFEVGIRSNERSLLSLECRLFLRPELQRLALCRLGTDGFRLFPQLWQDPARRC